MADRPGVHLRLDDARLYGRCVLGRRELGRQCIFRTRRSNRKGEAASPKVKRQHRRSRRRPNDWPIGGGQSDPHAVSRPKAMRHAVQLNLYRDAHSRFHRRQILMAVAMCEIEHSIAHPCHAPIRHDLAKRDRNERIGLIGTHHQIDYGKAENLHIAVKRLGVEQKLPALFHPLISRLVGDDPVGTPLSRRQPHRLQRMNRCPGRR